jgi:hypothetical protein
MIGVSLLSLIVCPFMSIFMCMTMVVCQRPGLRGGNVAEACAVAQNRAVPAETKAAARSHFDADIRLLIATSPLLKNLLRRYLTDRE